MNVLTCGKPGYLGQIIADKVLRMYEPDKLLRLCFQYNFMDKKSFASPHCSVLNKVIRNWATSDYDHKFVILLTSAGENTIDFWAPLFRLASFAGNQDAKYTYAQMLTSGKSVPF